MGRSIEIKQSPPFPDQIPEVNPEALPLVEPWSLRRFGNKLPDIHPVILDGNENFIPDKPSSRHARHTATVDYDGIDED